MGGGQDLNLKKSWHPSTKANLEKVWQAEREVELEHKKYEELKKEMELDKERDEWREMQIKTGHLQRQKERVEWMYALPAHLQQEQDDQLLLKQQQAASGVAVAATDKSPTTTEPKVVAVSSGMILGRRAVFDMPVADTVQSKADATVGFTGINDLNRMRDLENKMREDPLYQIKVEEQRVLQEKRAAKKLLKQQKKAEVDAASMVKQVEQERTRMYDDDRRLIGQDTRSSGRYEDARRQPYPRPYSRYESSSQDRQPQRRGGDYRDFSPPRVRQDRDLSPSRARGDHERRN